MWGFNRRSFLAASAAFVAAPAVARAQPAAEADVAIIGAGAAGIAAARRVAAANRRFVLFEANNRVGGRCLTDLSIFGVPFDLGAHWLHRPDTGSFTGSTPTRGLDIYSAPRAQTVRLGPRDARDAELYSSFATCVRSRRAIVDTGRGRNHIPAARAMPADLGYWRPTAGFVLGPFAYSKDLSAISAVDIGRAAEREI